MTKTPKARGREVSARLDELSDDTLSIDADEVGDEISYTEQDAMNALQIFMHVCSNISIHHYMKSGIPLHDTVPAHVKKAKKLSILFKEFTGIDSRTFYNPPSQHGKGK